MYGKYSQVPGMGITSEMDAMFGPVGAIVKHGIRFLQTKL